MILQALKEYYDRKATDPDSDIAALGFEWKEIPFIVTLKPDGTPVSFASTYEGSGKTRQAKKFLVPMSVKRTVGIASNLLWDNPEYALGITLKGKPERVKQQHAAFVKRVEDLRELNDQGIESLLDFLACDDKADCLGSFAEVWKEMTDSGGNLSFALAGEKGLILDRPSVRESVARAAADQSGETSVCLVTGDEENIEPLHSAIKGVWGAQSSGANIVAFNLSAFTSFGKKQGANAPVGKAAAFAYTTAINHLLRRDSPQRMQVGDASTVCWAEKPNDLETGIVDIFGEPLKDDPDRGTKAVRGLFKSVESGASTADDKRTRFYVLGLAPNASRISIRFWIVSTVADMASKIVQHFRDVEISHGPRDPDTLSLFRLLVSTAALGKAENIPPNLGGETMRAILEGLPYPQTLLQAAIRRNRAEQSVTYPRASLIKACINRRARFDNPKNKEELKVSLDTSNTNIGYRLGRLFATLEKIQAEANPGINATIRDRFYGSASGTPVAVFSNLMRLKNHHLAKLESPGRRVNFEKLIAEIMDSVTDFPTHLSMPDQGRFAIGYYHQNQDFYTKKSDKSNSAHRSEEGDTENE